MVISTALSDWPALRVAAVIALCDDAPKMLTQSNLMMQVRALNATDSGQTPDIFRAWSRRLEPPSHPLSSNEDDPELIVHVPFTGSMKIKAFSVIGGTDGSAPASVRIFVNRDDLDFSAAADLQPVQSFSLQENHRGDMEYPTQYASLQSMHSCSIAPSLGCSCCLLDGWMVGRCNCTSRIAQ